MQISRYINIPANQSISSTHRYLSYSQLLVSLLTGILLITFNIINQYTVTHSEFQIIYLFTLIIIVKIGIPINYVLRSKSPKSRLQQEAKINLAVLFVPGFMKSMLYFGLMMMTLYLEWLLIVIPVLVAIIGVEVLDWWIKRKTKYLLLSNSIGKQQKRSYKQKSSTSCINIKQIVIEILLVLAYLFHVQYFELIYNIQTILAICIIGTFSLLAYYYMHHQVFQLYHSDVDEVLAKEYPIQLFNFILYWVFHQISASSSVSDVPNDANNSTLSAVNNMANTKNSSSPGFLFILQYPVHSAVAIFFSVLYEYFSFEMIKKSSFKYLFFTQLTGIFWFNLYLLREGLTTSRYFSTFLSFIALVLLTRFISIEKLSNRISRGLKWLKNKNNRKRNDQSNNMVEQQVK